MNESLKRYCKLFIPVAARIIERNTQIHDKELNELFGISSIHIRYILILGIGKYTLKELSECLFFNKANTTRAISSLRNLGYVTDDRTSINSRKYSIFLMSRGREVLKYLKEKRDSDIDVFFEGISDQDFKNFLNVMERVCMNIDKDGQYVKTLKKLNDAMLNDVKSSTPKEILDD